MSEGLLAITMSASRERTPAFRRAGQLSLILQGDTKRMKSKSKYPSVPWFLIVAVCCGLAASASAQDEYIVARDTISLWTVNTDDTREVNRVSWWHPELTFILYGPPGKGYVVWLEAGLPGKKKWFSRECAGNPIGESSDKFRDAQQATEIRCDTTAATDRKGDPRGTTLKTDPPVRSYRERTALGRAVASVLIGYRVE